MSQSAEEEEESSKLSPINADDECNESEKVVLPPPQDEDQHCAISDSDDDQEPVKDSNETVTGTAEENAVPVSDDEEADTSAGHPDVQNQSNVSQLPYEPIIGVSPTILSGEMDDIAIARDISNYMHSNKINIGELDGVEDMWGICDAISAAHSGLPDSLLKAAFLLVLEGYYGHAQNNSWMRIHLDHFLRIWKKEILKEKSTPRPTKFVSASNSDAQSAEQHEGGQQQKFHKPTEAADVTINGSEKTDESTSQTPESGVMSNRRQKRLARKRKQALASIMGVGSVLTLARRKFATEDGDLEINEDEYGNFTIGGVALSFENWGKINKSKNCEIARIGEQSSPKRWKDSGQSQPNGGGTFSESPSTVAASKGPSMAEQYPTVGEVEMPSVDGQQQQSVKELSIVALESSSVIEDEKELSTPVKAKSVTPPSSEKDEGELSSSEPSDKATSSSDEDEGAQKKAALLLQLSKNVAKKKVVRSVPERKNSKQKEEKQQQGVSSAQNLQNLLRKCFDLRCRIVRKLSIQQKAMFLDLLKQSVAGTLHNSAEQQQQHQALVQLMGSISSSYSSMSGGGGS